MYGRFSVFNFTHYHIRLLHSAYPISKFSRGGLDSSNMFQELISMISNFSKKKIKTCFICIFSTKINVYFMIPWFSTVKFGFLVRNIFLGFWNCFSEGWLLFYWGQIFLCSRAATVLQKIESLFPCHLRALQTVDLSAAGSRAAEWIISKSICLSKSSTLWWMLL